MAESPGDTEAAPPRAIDLPLLVTRVLFTLAVVATLGGMAIVLFRMIHTNGTTALEAVIFPLTIVLLFPIVVSFWMAILGFLVERRSDKFPRQASNRSFPSAGPTAGRTDGPTDGRTAIVVPVYNEDIPRVLVRLKATRASLELAGHADAFDFHILSDTRDAQGWIEEEVAVSRFRAQCPDPSRIHYRNRSKNAGRKAGNIADFCRSHGSHYRYMIVFDADSLMSGTTLVELVRLMDEHPEAGIIQAPPLPVNRRTLFGRWQQFAARAYGPTWGAGLAYLQSGTGNYYGHNAIIRIEPFKKHCQLPTLSGPEPLGGSILSHDFVEAALMRRAGYKVYLVPYLDGSFEEAPPTLVDYAVRDRRWCQGNMQHARLLGTPRLHPISRVHLLLGVMSYLASPLWILVLLLTTLEGIRSHVSRHDYFPHGTSLFPVWQISIQARAATLFSAVMVFLFLPRALAVISRSWQREERRGFGGGGHLLASFACEAFASILLSPVLAVMQTGFVISILTGVAVGWEPQSRNEGTTALAEAASRFGVVTLLGCLWGGLLSVFCPQLIWWMLPVLVGMVFSIPLSMLISHPAASDWAIRKRLWSTPEEAHPHPVLQDFRLNLEALGGPREIDRRPALERVLLDGEARAAHLMFTPDLENRDPVENHVVQGLILKCRLHGPATLNEEEQRHLLHLPRALRGLADRPDEELAAADH